MSILEQWHQASQDWDGTRYSAPTISASASRQTRTHAHPWQKPKYGTKQQYAPAPDTFPFLDAPDTQRLQQIIGPHIDSSSQRSEFGADSRHQIHHGKDDSVCSTILCHSTPTPPFATRPKQATMVLWIHSDDSYLSTRNAGSRAGGGGTSC